MRHSGLYALTSLAAAAFLVACGGGGGGDSATSDTPTAVTATTAVTAADRDEADPATVEQAKAIVAAAEDALSSKVASSSSKAGEAPALSHAAGWRGWYPGLAQTNLVANKPEFGAQLLEPDMKNPWGIAIRPAGFGGHFWVGASGTGKSLQYVGDVGGKALFQDELKVVETGGPVTGVSFNPGTGFIINQTHANGPITAPAKFFFANASGTISAWTERARPGGGFDHPADSVTVVNGTQRASSFLGVTVSPSANRMLVADFGADAQLRVYDGAFAEQAPLSNPFRPEGKKVPGGFEAFNVQTVDQSVFAMYGRQVPPNPDTPPPAEGRLVEFDGQGQVLARWHGRGYLNYPWGVAKAPKDFGVYGGCLLVGNFGDGSIVAFHPRLKVALDYVRDTHGKRVVIDGLWGLQFGNGASLGEADHMYFAAGPNKEKDGLFGKLQANPKTPAILKGLSLCS